MPEIRLNLILFGLLIIVAHLWWSWHNRSPETTFRSFLSKLVGDVIAVIFITAVIWLIMRLGGDIRPHK